VVKFKKNIVVWKREIFTIPDLHPFKKNIVVWKLEIHIIQYAHVLGSLRRTLLYGNVPFYIFGTTFYEDMFKKNIVVWKLHKR
jgi:hypothetical protein